jgi:PhnB protein
MVVVNEMNEGEKSQNFRPEGWPTVIARIIVPEAEAFVEFVKSVFQATGDYHPDRPAVLNIGGSLLMISDAGIRERATAFLYVYVTNTDATYKRALQAGARSVEEPTDLPYGDRRGMIEDRWGNIWQIATYVGTDQTTA